MHRRNRNLQASWRDTLLLLKQFRIPLFVFVAAILGSGVVYYLIGMAVHEPVNSLAGAIYLTLTLAFLQPSIAFPQHPVLQMLFFIMPLIGIGTLAQGLADFGILLFNRRARNKEWEMAVASTFSKHTILVGLGHLGYRVVEELQGMGESMVVIELNPSADLVAAVQKMGIPVIQDDATRPTALEAAGILRARTIVLCSQNDAMNLQIAVKARSLNPKIQVVIRIFDDDFASSLQDQFGFRAMSATAMAAPAFAAAAAGADITNPITVEGESLSLARLTISAGSPLEGKQVGSIEQQYDVSVVLIKHDGFQDMHPPTGQAVVAGDTLAVLGTPKRLNQIVHDKG